VTHKKEVDVKKNSKPAARKTTVKRACDERVERRTIGVDLGDQTSHYCVLDSEGEVFAEGTFSTTEAGFAKQFHGIGRTRIAIETGTHSPWVSRYLEKLGHEVVIANARQLRMIYATDRKTDRVDARTLARLVRVDKDLLHPIRHRGAEAQADLALLRARDLMVAVRSKLINCVRGIVKSVGGRLPSGSAECFPRKVRDHVPEAVRGALFPILDQIESVIAGIHEYDKAIEAMGKKKYPKTELMRQIPGVGPLTSLAFLLTIDDPNRFQRSRDVGGYLGLCPKQCDSGDSKPQLSITKAGDPMVRRLLINCAHHILGRWGSDCDIRRWGLSLMVHGGKNAKKRAIVAVSRKLAVLMHKLWVTGEVYEPLRRAGHAVSTQAAAAA
jgi:transposase